MQSLHTDNLTPHNPLALAHLLCDPPRLAGAACVMRVWRRVEMLVASAEGTLLQAVAATAQNQSAAGLKAFVFIKFLVHSTFQSFFISFDSVQNVKIKNLNPCNDVITETSNGRKLIPLDRSFVTKAVWDLSGRIQDWLFSASGKTVFPKDTANTVPGGSAGHRQGGIQDRILK